MTDSVRMLGAYAVVSHTEAYREAGDQRLETAHASPQRSLTGGAYPCRSRYPPFAARPISPDRAAALSGSDHTIVRWLDDEPQPHGGFLRLAQMRFRLTEVSLMSWTSTGV